MKFTVRFLALLFALLFLVSCNEKEDGNETELLKGYFSAPLTVTAKDGKLSFDLEDEKITVTYPEILKGTEIFYTGKGLTAKLNGQLTELPKSFTSSVVSILNIASKLKSGDITDFYVQDGIIFWDTCTFTVSDDEIKAFADGREFIIKKRNEKEDEKNKSYSGS